MDKAKPVLMPLGLAFLISGFVVFQMWPGRTVIQIGLLVTGSLLFALGLFWQRAELIDLLRTRAVRSGAAAFLYSLVILSIWILVNWLAIRHSVRFDLTEEKIYTLDPRTVEELKRLDQPIAILAFVGSADEGARVRIRDLMEEFRHHTDQIDYEFIDPFKNPGQVEAFDIAAEGTLVFQSGGRTVKEVRRGVCSRGIRAWP